MFSHFLGMRSKDNNCMEQYLYLGRINTLRMTKKALLIQLWICTSQPCV